MLPSLRCYSPWHKPAASGCRVLAAFDSLILARCKVGGSLNFGAVGGRFLVDLKASGRGPPNENRQIVMSSRGHTSGPNEGLDFPELTPCLSIIELFVLTPAHAVVSQFWQLRDIPATAQRFDEQDTRR